jgi:hypothetical protein
VSPTRPSLGKLTAKHNVHRVFTDHFLSYDGFVRIDMGTGEQLKTFNIHVALLKARSGFFNEALGEKWQEAEEKVVRLPEYCPIMFQAYVHCLYSGKLAVKSEKKQSQKDELYELYKSLAHLYVFAEKMKDVESKNSIIRAIVATSETTYSRDS